MRRRGVRTFRSAIRVLGPCCKDFRAAIRGDAFSRQLLVGTVGKICELRFFAQHLRHATMRFDPCGLRRAQPVQDLEAACIIDGEVASEYRFMMPDSIPEIGNRARFTVQRSLADDALQMRKCGVQMPAPDRRMISWGEHRNPKPERQAGDDLASYQGSVFAVKSPFRDFDVVDPLVLNDRQESIVPPPVMSECHRQPIADAIAQSHFDGLDRKVECLTDFCVPQIQSQSPVNIMPGGVEICAEPQGRNDFRQCVDRRVWNNPLLTTACHMTNYPM